MIKYIIDWLITYAVFFVEEWVYRGKPSFLVPLLITIVLAFISYLLLEPKKTKAKRH